ncbi:MAG: hypothetical protein J7480_06500, partial [Microbacteriaceae bacterium]|nr:hypothetical protein [Microbacteriaceae bacterium]
LLDRSTSALSAGEAQLVAIAAAVVADPVLLLVDEPLAELDAAGRERIVALLAALAHEAGACVVVAEHRTRWFDGVADQTVSLVVPPTASAAAPGVPAASAVPAGPSGHVRVERTIADGSDRRERVRAEEQSRPHAAITAIIGPNGAGKSTELLRRAQAEPKRVALVPEALELLFTTDSVAAECRLADRRAARGACSASPWARTARLHGEAEPFASTGDALTAAAEAPWAQTARSAVGTGPFAPTGAGRSGGGAAGRTLAILSRLLGRDASALAERHPRDCSGGERLCLALAIQLVRGTPELLVDEPFRGLDARATAEVLTALRRAAEGGVAVTIATHELELAAELAGTVVEMGAPGAGDGGSHPSTRLRLAQGASSTRLRLAQGTSSTRLGAAQGAGSTGAER